MSSTSTNKKGIADFLWEWAECQGDWGRLLVDQIVRTENVLPTPDRQKIFNFFLQSIGLHKGLPPITLSKPNYKPTPKEIQLVSLSGIAGVNRLAKNQTMTFSKHSTVIYGENGTGKTGYSRVLRSLGFSYDNGTVIHHNAYGKYEPKAATISFTIDGMPKVFAWTGKNTDPDLENISVFNSNCVQISLADRQLIVAPIGFHLFTLVTTELQELNKVLEAKKMGCPIFLPWLVNLIPGTPQSVFIESLSHKSSEAKLTELSTFNSAEHEKEKSTMFELSNLNKSLLEGEIKTLNIQRMEIGELILVIQSTKEILSKTHWELITGYTHEIGRLEAQTQTGLKEIAETRGIEFYATSGFQRFLTSAEEYIKLLTSADYPQREDVCVYCRQPLDESARQLLTAYRQLLNDRTQERLKECKKSKSDVLARITRVIGPITLHQYTFGSDKNHKPIQPELIKEYNAQVESLKATFLDGLIDDPAWVSIDYAKYLGLLTATKTSIENAITSKEETVGTMASKEKELRAILAELADRKMLASKLTEIKTAMHNHKIVEILKSNASSFGTGPISRKTSEAREELVRQNFNNLFKDELKAFRKSDIKIELSFGTERGNSKVTQRIHSHVPIDILSEGEQKAIALAEFLTELQLDDVKAPVIFDDPVNSLDHRIIDEVAKRLIRLSETRQVIIFTHSILLLNSYLQQKALDTNKSLEFVFHSVKSNFGETGILDSVEEINSFNYYMQKVRVIANSKHEGMEEGQVAAQGYGHLRAAIEVSVEEDILKHVVKRYRKGVAFPALLRVDGTKIDALKGNLNDIYEKCCVYIDGHAAPSGVHTTPTIGELKGDTEEFMKIRGNFTK